MALGNPIQIRLNVEKQAIYEDEAARLNKPLGTYLRERLEAEDVTRGELNTLRHEIGIGLSAIRQTVEDGGGKRGTATAATALSQINNALMLEMVLLMREIGGPERVKRTQAELKRQGLQMWTPSKE